jgi:hypothetical protein
MSQSEVNYEVVNVRLDLTVRQAEEIRDILFEAQRGYSLEFVPERINGIREVIQQLDVNLIVKL